jgi:hypothetical protein
LGLLAEIKQIGRFLLLNETICPDDAAKLNEIAIGLPRLSHRDWMNGRRANGVET